MSFNIDQKRVKDVIADIVKNRALTASRLSDEGEKLSKALARARSLRRHLTGLKDGIASVAEGDVTARAVLDGCCEYIEQAARCLNAGAICEEEFRQVQEHFRRDSFCVASAGGSQAGKSTTLQKLVGLDDKDPTCPIVGGGTGNSTTATRCRIVNIGSDERSHSRIEFFTRQEFFQRIVQPYCRELQKVLSLPPMSSYEDFMDFDVSTFERERAKEIAELGARERIKKYYVRFCSLRQKLDEYGCLLEEPMRDVGIEEAYKYLVYPTAKPSYNNLQAWCYAVKEVTLYCRYPNPVVDKIAFFDLPGAGEVAPDVEKRYAEGFDLKTDTVVYVGRFDGRIYGNADVSMVDVLGDVVPPGQLENFMIHFQNDFHQVTGVENKLVRVAEINKGSRKDAYAVIGRAPDISIYRIPAGTVSIDGDCGRYEVSDIGPDGFVVIFGEGNDSEYVSGTLLPVICDFAAKRLPKLDAALVESVLGRSEGVIKEIETLFAGVEVFASDFNKRIPSSEVGFSNEVNKRVMSLRNAFWHVRGRIDDMYRKGALVGLDAPSIQTATGIRDSIRAELQTEESGLLLEKDRETVLRRLRTAVAQPYGLSGQLESYLRTIRVTIVDRYAKLENVYSAAIASLQAEIFKLIGSVNGEEEGVGVPLLLQEGGEEPLIDRWIELTESAGCVELGLIARDLKDLEVKFYLTVYPDVRRRVFRSTVNDVYKKYLVDCTSEEECYAVLRDLAEDWTSEAGDCICERNAALEIMYSAVDRFFERTLCVAKSDEELHRFVSYYWHQLEEVKLSPGDICKAKLSALLKEINGQKEV